MGRVQDTIRTINTTLRTLLMTVLVAAAGVGGYKLYDVYNEPRQQLADKQAELDATASKLQRANEDLSARQKEITELTNQVATKTAEINRLEVRLRLLKVHRRLARLTVLDQRELPASDPAPVGQPVGDVPAKVVTKIEFVEVNDKGDSIGQPKQFDIIGDTVYVDYLHVTFEDKYIEQSDLDRSTSIALFQRLFGAHQEPVEGFQLDTVGTRPTAYGRGTEMSDFERKIWDDFWLIANDPQRATELGIKAAHGSAVSMRMQPNKTYEVELRATGEMTIRPIEDKSASTVPGT
jgi:hypothetical protein